MPPRKKLPKKPRVTPGVYWHGGPTGLSIGDMIIPANELEQLPGFYGMSDYAISDPNRVYITNVPLIAENFAAMKLDWSQMPPRKVPGAVYQVTPIGDVEEDPDYAGTGELFSCERARIEAIAKPRVQVASHQAQMAVLRHHTWDDGAPMYDTQGFANPPAVAAALGVTNHDLRPLGVGASPEAINDGCHQVLQHRGVDVATMRAVRDRIATKTQ